MVYNILLNQVEQFEMNLMKIKYSFKKIYNQWFCDISKWLEMFWKWHNQRKELLSLEKSWIFNLSPFVTNPILALHPN